MSKIKKQSRIFVTGFLGSDRKALGQKIASELGYQIMDLDEEIEKAEGRSIQRICMIMGEHEYRNKEFEMLRNLSHMEEIVVVCGDGVMLDHMSLEIMEQDKILIADAELNGEELWEKAKKEKNLPYAFMNMENDDLRKERFLELYQQRKPMYDRVLSQR